MYKFHTSGLSIEQYDAIPLIGKYANLHGFYLAGGTALSIYYGHRRSVDLDWFCTNPLQDPTGLAQRLRDEGISFKTLSIDQGTLNGFVGGVKVSFMEYRYDPLQSPAYWQEGGCNLVSLDDLACMKLTAVAQRGARKDFIDIYTLVKNHKLLPELLALYKKKYQIENVLPVLMGLVYFDDAENEPDPALWAIEWKTVKKEISTWVRKAQSQF